VNNVRFIPSIAGFIYATRPDALYVNLFAGGQAEVQVGSVPLTLDQKTDYPWDGTTTISLKKLGAPSARFALKIRIPGWARNEPVPSNLYRYSDGLTPKISLRVNGRRAPLNLERGYAVIEREWKAGDRVVLELEMPVRTVVSHPSVKANQNRFAIERGPVVYCAEGADNGGVVLDKVFPGPVRFKLAKAAGLPRPIVAIRMKDAGAELTCIPYYAWCHRGPNEMRVWFPTRAVEKLASHCWELDSVEACFDGKIPTSSGDHSIPRFTWWPRRGSTEWIIRRFEQPVTVSSTAVYWFDDSGSGGCRVPKSWRLAYWDGATWKPVPGLNPSSAHLNAFNEVRFTPVHTSALRLEADLQPEFSGGILEWK
jgi:hypothetical protein